MVDVPSNLEAAANPPGKPNQILVARHKVDLMTQLNSLDTTMNGYGFSLVEKSNAMPDSAKSTLLQEYRNESGALLRVHRTQCGINILFNFILVHNGSSHGLFPSSFNIKEIREWLDSSLLKTAGVHEESEGLSS